MRLSCDLADVEHAHHPKLIVMHAVMQVYLADMHSTAAVSCHCNNVQHMRSGVQNGYA